MNKIRVILRKEWLELRQEKVLLLTTGLLPLFFALAPLVFAFVIKGVDVSDMQGEMKDFEQLLAINPAFQGMNMLEFGQAVIGQQISLMFLLLPMILPSVIASYSVVGEKNSRTLEPVLATPVTTLEFLLAKSITAVLPSMIMTWVAGAIFALGMIPAAVSARAYAAVVSPTWVLMLLLWAPLLSLITVGLTVLISSKANDPRSAQQISVVLILPMIGLIVAQLSGVLVLGPLVVIGGAVALALVAAIVMNLAVQFFQRESILTRWS
ncbi:MAG: type transport system permease protein [Chloroflexia bacterium]|nr:type transport system permease protein [Chloroflexia bacterium]